MKLNNKGFAISGILYAVMILFLTIVVALLAMISNRKLALDKYKKNVKTELNEAAETYGARVQISPDTTYVRINEEEVMEYDFKGKVSGCINDGAANSESNSLCQENESDITNLLNYKIYDEIGNEVIGFNTNTVTSSDNYKVDLVYYTYNEKDSKGNYVLDETRTKLKVVTKYLSPNVDNIFYVRYSVVDNNNTVSKEATRTLVIRKYTNYVNVVTNYFKIDKENINGYDFKQNANSYTYASNTLTKDNTILQYKLYNGEDEPIADFYKENGSWYYHANSVSVKVTGDEKFRVRYFTGTVENPTSEINFGYFTVE